MDWIEQIFRFNPDGGDGSAEVLIVFVFTVTLTLLLWRIPEFRRYILQKLLIQR